jgi:hypothetical protein
MIAGVGEELGDLADAADVLVAVLGEKPRSLLSPWRMLSPSSTVGDAATLHEDLLKAAGDGGLARAGEAREPDVQPRWPSSFSRSVRLT